MSDIIGYNDEEVEVRFNYTLEKMNDLFAKADESEIFTSAEKEKLSTLENYDDTELKSETSKTAEEAALNRITLGYQRKNLLKNTAASRTVRGVTFTVNADGSVTANGTATANADFDITVGSTAGDFILSGCPADGGSSKYYIAAYYTAVGSTSYVHIGSDAGSGKSINIPSNAENTIVRIRINSGQTVDNVIFYPMIRPASVRDDSYEPYKPSVEERLAALEEKFAVSESSAE